MIQASRGVRASSFSSAVAARGSAASYVFPAAGLRGIAPIARASAPAAIATGETLLVAHLDHATDRAVLARFIADLRAAPQITGELTALYVEQHPTLAMHVVDIALNVTGGDDAIRDAAAWRRACGATWLADVLEAALMFASLRRPPPDDGVPLLSLRELDRLARA